MEVPAIISEWNLGKGESQVIAFAFQNKEFAAAIDDKAAKKCAEVFNISISGTIAIIIKARKKAKGQGAREEVIRWIDSCFCLQWEYRTKVFTKKIHLRCSPAIPIKEEYQVI